MQVEDSTAEEDTVVFIVWADDTTVHTAMALDSLATVNPRLVQGRGIALGYVIKNVSISEYNAQELKNNLSDWLDRY